MNKFDSTTDTLQFSCQYHKQYEPSFMYLNPDAKDILLCNKCLDEPEYTAQSLENFQQMQLLLQSDEKTILPKWPPLQDRNCLREIQTFLNDHSDSTQNYKNIIHHHFESLEKAIVDHIQSIKKQTLIKYDNLQKIEEDLFACYNQFSYKEKIINVLKDPKIDFNHAHSHLKVFLGESIELQNENEEQIKRIYNDYTQYIKLFDTDKLNALSKSITEVFHNLSYFPDLVDTDYTQNNARRESPQQKLLLQLIKNPFNYLSKEFEMKIDDILQPLPQQLYALDISNSFQPNKSLLNLNQISEEQRDLIHQLVDLMKEKKNKVYPFSEIDPSVYPTTKSFFQYLNPKYSYLVPSLIAQKLPIFELYQSKMQFIVSDFKQSIQYLNRTNKNQISVFKKIEGNCNYKDNKIISNLYLKVHSTYQIIFQATPMTSSYQIGLTSTGFSSPLESDQLFIQMSNTKESIYKLISGTILDLFNSNEFCLRINLSKGQFEISDFPNSNNIIRIPQKPNQNMNNKFIQTSYQIGFSLCCPQSELIILKILEQ